jgi:thiamine-monophosphate kinase
MNEFELIQNYFQKLSKNTPASLSLNDDVFFDKNKKLVVSVDTYIEGNHFINFKKPDLVIKKIIRSSISDLISKGVFPKYYFISASGNNKNFTKSNLLKIIRSLSQEQKKYKIYLSGGDTVLSKKLSFTITSIGFANNIISRNKTKLNDDVYVTGNIGDSYLGLLILKNKIKLQKRLKEYFIKQYYKPDIQHSLIKHLKKFANSSIDLSDGLLSDLEKLINKQNYSYKILLNKIPISKNLSSVLNLKKLLKKNFISRGDDYQILFTASSNKRSLIKKISSFEKLKVTRIGKIVNYRQKSSIIDRNGNKIKLNFKGHFHNFS